MCFEEGKCHAHVVRVFTHRQCQIGARASRSRTPGVAWHDVREATI